MPVKGGENFFGDDSVPSGRTRQFGVDEALEQALEVFWARGYEVCVLPVHPPAAAFGHSGQLGRHPRGTDENRAASPSAIVGWVRMASRSAV